MALALVVCFQEIKLNVINSALMMETLGPSFDEFYYLPASQTRGGILLAWNSSKASCHTTSLGEYSIIAKVVLPNGSSTWLTVVYGPHEDGSKNTFLQELCHIHSSFLGPWMVLGDFNLILQLQDKNNACVNRRRMGSFHHLMDDLELREVHLNGRAFTWSNATERLTLERIDRVFVTADWELCSPIASLGLCHPRLLITAHFYCPRSSSSAPRKDSVLNPSGLRSTGSRLRSNEPGTALWLFKTP